MDELLNYAGADGWMSMSLGTLVRTQRRFHFNGRCVCCITDKSIAQQQYNSITEKTFRKYENKV